MSNRAFDSLLAQPDARFFSVKKKTPKPSHRLGFTTMQPKTDALLLCILHSDTYLAAWLSLNRALNPSHFHNMITAGIDKFVIMRDYQNGSAAFCCLFQFLRNQPHVLPIKTTGWFIKDQNPALRKDSAGDGQPLLLTAGHGRWVCIPIRIKPELLQ